MRVTKKRLYLALGVLCLVVCLVFVILAIPRRNEVKVDGGPSRVTSLPNSEAVSDESTGNTDTSDTVSPSETTSEPEQYDSPVDFDTLQDGCADIYAWLEIPGTEPDISYPVAQSQTDDTFYLNHNINGEKDSNGTLYTEHRYNGMDFSDPVTIIYGHNMRSGAMFGYLQEQFSKPEWFEEHQEIIVYLPERELHYQVFAAVPYGTTHILYSYQSFQESSAMTEFLDSVYSIRKFGTNYNKECPVSETDRILVLSTCLPRSADGRYLVLAKLVEVIGEPFEE